MTAMHVLHLMALECLLAQELDGDEIYLRLNGEKVWSIGRHEHMSHLLDKPHRYDRVNFSDGTRQSAAGWEPIPDFAADSLTWRFDGDAVVEVFEADAFNRDDLIGRQHVSARDAGHGAITVHFERDGAKYALTYRVEAGADGA